MITEVKTGSALYDQVVALGDANRATLGLLKYAAIEQAAEKGGLLAFADNGEVMGYALFSKRVRTGDISLTHLCVDRNQRGRGIARELVEGIVERNPHRAGIRLSCRKDYPANSMWPTLKFQALGERSGRGKAGLPLVVWWRRISAVSLFDDPEMPDTRPVVAVDSGVLLDVCDDSGSSDAQALIADWVEDSVVLAVTEQSISDLSEDRTERGDAESALSEFRHLEPSEPAWMAVLGSLLDDAETGAAGEPLLRVVAQASAGGASRLITKAEPLLGLAERLEQIAGLKPVTADDFLLRLHSLGGELGHQPLRRAAAGISIAPVKRMPSDAELAAYVHQHISGDLPSLRQCLKLAYARDGLVAQMTTETGQPLALGAISRPSDKPDRAVVTALRCDEGAASIMHLRQMIHHLRRAASEDGAGTITVEDLTGNQTEKALQHEGFRYKDLAWFADIQAGVYTTDGSLPRGLDHLQWADLGTQHVRDYERHCWPAKMFTGAVPCYIVPIKPAYARDLLGYDEPQEQLFNLNRQAALSRDNIYYKSPYTMEAPSRIIWWVSGGKDLGGVRAMSWMDECETGPARDIHSKYSEHGVLDLNQVLEIANTPKHGPPKVTAMLFSQTEIFPQPVPLDKSKELCEEMRKPGYLQTVKPIKETTVRQFYEEGKQTAASG